MLLVKTYVKQSEIPNAGLGLFAAEFIVKGTRIWEFTKNFDRILTEKEVSKLGEAGIEFIKLMFIIINTAASGSCVLIMIGLLITPHHPTLQTA